MSISKMLDRFSTNVSIQTPTTTTANEYNQYEYNSISVIQGRLIEENETIDFFSTSETDRNVGEKTLSKGKLYTTELLQNKTKVGNFHIFHKRIGKDKNNIVQWYLYYLK